MMRLLFFAVKHSSCDNDIVSVNSYLLSQAARETETLSILDLQELQSCREKDNAVGHVRRDKTHTSRQHHFN